MAKKGTIAGIPLGALVIFIIGIIAILYILKNKNLFKFGIVTAGATVGETTVPGPNVYPVVGQITPVGEWGLSDANDGTSFRDNVSFPCDKCARETTWFVIDKPSLTIFFSAIVHVSILDIIKSLEAGCYAVLL